MSADDMTIGEMKKLACLFGAKGECGSPFKVGRAYLFCGVTRYTLGRVRAVHGNLVELDDASWVPDTGRFSEAFKKFTLAEVERGPDGGIVNTDAISDAWPWEGDLPKETK